MNNYLLYFSIGPVQSFIAQARKVIDLYGGSRMLSDVIHNILNIIPQDSIIYPKNIENPPNLFIVELKDTNKAKVKEYAEKIENDIRENIKCKAMGLLDRYWNNNKNGKLKEKGEAQIKDFLSIHWAAVLSEDEKYPESYKKLIQLAGAVKNTRIFKQFPETGRKCSVCGERNVLF